MTQGNKNKQDQLGMSPGKANNILKKSVLFFLVKKLGLDTCFHCSKKIEDIQEFSLEHKTPWQDSENPTELFFSLDNISFSHLRCNIISIRRKAGKHPSTRFYQKGCRCDGCKDCNAEAMYKYRLKKHGF